MNASHCSNCLTSQTPLWRRGPKDSTSGTAGSSTSTASSSLSPIGADLSPSQSPAVQPVSPIYSGQHTERARKSNKRDLQDAQPLNQPHFQSRTGEDEAFASTASDDEERTSSNPDRAQDEPYAPPAKQLKADPMVNWVMCDFCYQWRKLPSSVPKSSLPNEWVCAMHPIKKHAVCSFRNPARSCSKASPKMRNPKDDKLKKEVDQSPSVHSESESSEDEFANTKFEGIDAIQTLVNFADSLACELLKPFQKVTAVRRRTMNSVSCGDVLLSPEDERIRKNQELNAIHLFGSIIHELLTLQLTHLDAHSCSKITNHWCPTDCPKKSGIRSDVRFFIDLAMRCMDKPELRPTSQEILKFTRDSSENSDDD
eukprot:TRINITY_DN401_c0_g2_i1.p1 TRINITY_DN401_c0_g2~~TRINITY_DN401_c0_g2_i1.p1  ORF type:complete len:369 (-),score=41.95 TRINITY_DN401_c0_g2_i1:1207-2313(-)